MAISCKIIQNKSNQENTFFLFHKITASLYLDLYKRLSGKEMMKYTGLCMAMRYTQNTYKLMKKF